MVELNQTTKATAGSCNSCKCNETTVFEITISTGFGGIIFRLCPKCLQKLKNLIAKLVI